MKKIVLFCGAGMSSSLLVLKMRDAAKAVGYDCYIEAFAATNPQYAQDADAVLVGPHSESKNCKKKSRVRSKPSMMLPMAL